MIPKVLSVLLVFCSCFHGELSSTILPKVTTADINELKGKLMGDLYLPDSDDYNKRTTLLNTRFSARPRFIVMASNTADVQKSILFAKKFDMRVTVLSSGHDYIGRAIYDDTVHISLKRMKAFTVNKNDPSSDTGVSATVEPAQDWKTIYKTLYDKYGYLAVGGSCPTVAAGGYFLGGGHSPLTAPLGLGVDSVLEFEMVTRDGSIVKVRSSGITITAPDGATRQESDSDLFWATRGGGPGTLGVVTSYKIKLHHPPKGFVSATCSTYLKFNVPAGDTLGARFLDEYNEYIRNDRTGKVGGYILMGNTKGTDPTYKADYHGTVLVILLYFGNWTEAKEELQSFTKRITGKLLGTCTLTNYSKFYDYQKGSNDPTGFGTYIVNRFLHKTDFNIPLRKLFTETMLQQIPMGCTGALLGGKASEMPLNSSSVSPEFRQAVMSLTCGSAWTTPGVDMAMVEGIRDKFAPELYKHGKGVYLNEPDFYLKNWKQEYWGTNYDRLLKIKLKWDPNGTFWCRHCVASDLFTPSTRSLSPTLYHLEAFLILAVSVFIVFHLR